MRNSRPPRNLGATEPATGFRFRTSPGTKPPPTATGSPERRRSRQTSSHTPISAKTRRASTPFRPISTAGWASAFRPSTNGNTSPAPEPSPVGFLEPPRKTSRTTRGTISTRAANVPRQSASSARILWGFSTFMATSTNGAKSGLRMVIRKPGPPEAAPIAVHPNSCARRCRILSPLTPTSTPAASELQSPSRPRKLLSHQ